MKYGIEVRKKNCRENSSLVKNLTKVSVFCQILTTIHGDLSLFISRLFLPRKGNFYKKNEEEIKTYFVKYFFQDIMPFTK